jgi:hypothetical protein
MEYQYHRRRQDNVFRYPNLEMTCVSGFSFLATDTKVDLFRDYEISILKPKKDWNEDLKQR